MHQIYDRVDVSMIALRVNCKRRDESLLTYRLIVEEEEQVVEFPWLLLSPFSCSQRS